MKKMLLIATALIAITGCTSNRGDVAKVSNDPRPCAQNLTFDGSFAAGRTFKTNAVVEKVTKNTAFARILKKITMNGYQINNSDKSAGMISASQTVSYGQGKTVPLNVFIAPVKGGVKIDIVFVISGGLTTPVEGVRKEFCSIIEAASQD